ncbi:hypothetical protein DPMN_047839 [Dreissena polymorpha]|uniref:cellulase n=1 Tax=Dreissena polymorpha TaxID=45954 RepID=A0A9D4D9L0_DREPO|nr:hypothetical protein DPMN_047839 [Dreissena polymorpha]
MAYSSWVLNWGFLKFTDAYNSAGQKNQMCDMVKWPLQYFLKCWIPSENTLYVQVCKDAPCTLGVVYDSDQTLTHLCLLDSPILIN